MQFLHLIWCTYTILNIYYLDIFQSFLYFMSRPQTSTPSFSKMYKFIIFSQNRRYEWKKLRIIKDDIDTFWQTSGRTDPFQNVICLCGEGERIDKSCFMCFSDNFSLKRYFYWKHVLTPDIRFYSFFFLIFIIFYFSCYNFCKFSTCMRVVKE